ncbi:MAG: 2-phosphosulfolactate phosphatase [Dehalococcoidia bacterium]|jgi:2-phosphosulfolactate phosphatase|nr:2-phosphosulfolactate phosphatase [Dehalococcoidia bacterium]
MNVDVAFVPPAAAPTDRTCIVIDVLRATSVIAVLMDKGMRRIYPTATVQEARELRAELASDGTDVFLLGEQGGLPPEGFDAGNSPTALQQLSITAQIAVQATTNGTPALLACQGAPLVMAAAPLNAAEVTRLTLEAGHDVLIVCAGLRGGFAEDDTLAAGLFVERLVLAGAHPSDAANEALTRYEAARDNLADALRDTEHGRITVELGFDDDIELCGTADRITRVAVLGSHEGRPALEPHRAE